MIFEKYCKCSIVYLLEVWCIAAFLGVFPPPVDQSETIGRTVYHGTFLHVRPRARSQDKQNEDALIEKPQ